MEDFGQWSGGNKNNYDPRLPGGYENVPTVDIHMTQVGFQTQWLYFLKMIIQPVQKQVFLGYVHDVSFLITTLIHFKVINILMDFKFV
jgi:procollagen-lysine,2-oxoglutarate 5-dioxygenase